MVVNPKALVPQRTYDSNQSLVIYVTQVKINHRSDNGESHINISLGFKHSDGINSAS